MLGTLYFGGTIYTMKNENESVEAIFVENGKIKALGSKSSLEKQFRDECSNKIDLEGSVLYPGFVDSHLHIIGHGEKLLRLDLSPLTSSIEMDEVLRDRMDSANSGEWIIGDGWNENQFPDRKIFHRVELDDIAPDNPMVLTRVCRHAVLANSKALDLAGIDKHTPDPLGGVIVRDNDGEATGFLLDQAQELVKDVIPKVSEEYLNKTLTMSINHLLSLGLVGGHTEDLNYYGGFDRTFNTFLKVIDGKEKKFRANLLVHHGVVDRMHEAGYSYGETTPFVEIGAVKVFADGALGGRTALLSQPYNDAPETSGVAIHEIQGLQELVRKAREYEMPIAVHVIGDLALEYAIDAIEAFPAPKGKRDRLIHCQVVREDLLDRMSKLPIIADIQPRFVASDFPWVIERLGEQRMRFSYAWKTLLQNGIHCAGGSDAPIETVDPLLGIHAAVTRRHPDDKSHEGFYPEEKLSVYEAVKLFTSGSAYAISKENSRGLLEVGYDADFTVLDRDLFKISEDEIIKAKVKMTIVDDKIMYKQ